MRFGPGWVVVALAVSCSSRPAPHEPAPATSVPATASPAASPAPSLPATWEIYSPAPDHLWNRLYRTLYRRTTAAGEEYGVDGLDPPLWYETTYLLEGASHRQAISLLDEFLSADAELLVSAPLQRAVLQRDLWAVFDWLGMRSDTFQEERRALRSRLARARER